MSSPRLLIVVKQDDGAWSFFSSPQPQNHHGKSSVVLAADFHTKFFEYYSPESPDHWSYLNYCYSYASGLFYFTDFYCDHVERVICNPSTGQHAILPPDLTNMNGYPGGVLGFDPIGKQFKVLVLNDRVDDGSVYHILTLGTEKLSWREIKRPSIYSPDSSDGICINGVLYYISSSYQIGCFDFRSETFKLLNVCPVVNRFQTLINYKGKLCGSSLEYGHNGRFPLKLCMCVLEDVEKGEWSPYEYTLSDEDKLVKVKKDLSVVGATASGEIVLAKTCSYKPFYVFYFNPDKNTLLSVEPQGVREEDYIVYCIGDHVEDLNFDVMKATYAATSISLPEQSTKHRLEKIIKRGLLLTWNKIFVGLRALRNLIHGYDF